MHWADKIASEIITSGKFKPYWVDDMKTPSGFAHVGSLMGPVVHSMIFRALKDAGHDGNYTFVINDFDPVDGLSEELKKTHLKYMGFPLKNTPSPDPKFESLADYFANDFVNAIRSLGVEARTLSSWEMYHQGKFDKAIKLALDNAEKIQDIYEKVSGSRKKEAGWLPFQVICENCGKIGPNRVYGWDGKEVLYKCEPSMVTWAEGCGHEGKISPFGGNGKFPWKVDWAAHWSVIGVTIEGAGKDHASAGGSYDIAMAICSEIFGYEKPYRLPYEFILIGGRKMSSSKGLGLKAHDLVRIMPPELGRFLFASASLAKQSNFDPNGTMAIPDLFDDYDSCWKEFNDGGDEKMARTFVLSQLEGTPKKEKGFFVPRFRDVANYLSQGLTDEEILNKFAGVKGGRVDESEQEILLTRIKYAKVWNSEFAPSELKYELTDGVPSEVSTLSDDQKRYLVRVIKIVSETAEPDTLQVSLYELAKELSIPTKEAFSAVYTSLIGKTHGPRAGVLISSIGKEKVLKRLKEIVK